VTSGVVLGDKPKIYYRWEGGREGSEGQVFGGHGVIAFEDDTLDSAGGYYFDTNFARLAEGALTRVKHCRFYRCSAADEKLMRQPFSNEALALIKRRLKSLRG
jgi:hypothetical protein